MKRFALLLLVGVLASTASAAVVVQETFTYADGDVAGLNGGTGWASAWELGNGDLNTDCQFNVVSNEGIYIANGDGQQTEQNRTFASAITTGVNDTTTLTFNLIRPEGFSGRGIGIYLTNGGANQYFIGKEINGGVGLHTGMGIGSTDYAVFGTSAALEPIAMTITYDGTDTSMVMSDSNETLAAYTFAGQFTFDGISLAAYNGATLANGVDEISIDVTTVPEPATMSLLALGGIAMLRRKK